ncbi:MAG TPA: MFS transporter [Bryobacteraceae bacterium]|nr:MFS transporter [Bryobacteraceae bacterium]
MRIAPHIIRALTRSLRPDSGDDRGLRELSTSDWRTLLDFADQQHITLALASTQSDAQPAWVRDRLTKARANNAERFRRIRKVYSEIADALSAKGIEWTILKGFSQWPRADADLPFRPQYDIDLLCPPDAAHAAQAAVMALGYEPVTATDDEFRADHLAQLIRRTGWRWRGDYFDPELPVSVEIHDRLWDAEAEHLEVEGLDEFRSRRQWKSVAGIDFPALDPQDGLAYSALHLLRHLFRGDLLLWHVYEHALVLHRYASDDEFWLAWQRRYDAPFRTLQSIAFRIAHTWFGCRTSDVVVQELHQQPDLVQQWFDVHGREPCGGPLLAAKSEVWLHVSLLESRDAALHIVRRKLLPSQKRRPHHLPHVSDAGDSLKLKFERTAQHVRFIAGRAAYHLRALPVAATGGVSWWLRSRGLNPAFFRYLGAASLFNFGLSIFFLLYNLYLLRRGFREDLLGYITGAMTGGSIVGTVPAGFLTSRFGLKRIILFAFLATPVICAVRTLATGLPMLIASAFLAGFTFSMHAVAIAPAVAELVPSKARPTAFSLVFSIGIGIGMLGGLAGGMLPEWIGGYQPALLAAAAITGLSFPAAWRLALSNTGAHTRNIYPRNPAITRYLGALALWSLATGAFNPFFNVYFATQFGLHVHSIGALFSTSQLVQALAVLSAPFVLRRLGLPTGIMTMQIATGVSLGILGLGPSAAAAAVLYVAYMACQYMSEPGMYTFLMAHAKEAERGGASALNFLIVFAGQAIAAALSGMAVRQFGYGVVLAIASILAIIAGLCFRIALSRETPVLLERTVAQ